MFAVSAACSLTQGETETDCQVEGRVWVGGDGCSAGHCEAQPTYGYPPGYWDAHGPQAIDADASPDADADARDSAG